MRLISFISYLVKYMFFFLLVMIVQQLLVTYVHPFAMYADVVLPTLVLSMFVFPEKDTKWFFVIAFLVGLVKSVWMSQQLGLASLTYVIIALPYVFYKNLLQGSVQYLLIVILGLLVKFIVYVVIFFLLDNTLMLHFMLSTEFLYQSIGTWILSIVVFLPFLIYRRKKTR